MRPTHLRSALVTLSVAAALAGCGSKDPAAEVSAKIYRESLQLITPAEIQQQPPQTPFRALLEWWRLVQYRDASGASRYFTAEARRSAGPRFASTVYNDFGPWLQHVRPTLSRTEATPPTITVFLGLNIREVLSPSVVRDRKEIIAIPMQRVKGKWRIADATFYIENARRLQAERMHSRNK